MGTRRVGSAMLAAAYAIAVVLGVLGSSARAQPVTWTQKLVSGPAPRSLHAMAYDAVRGVTVLFGGITGAANGEGETWEWNGTDWTMRASSGPAPRYDLAVAYDSVRRVTVLFGGFNFSFDGSWLNGETWEWNGTGGGAWTQRAVSGPSRRYRHKMAYDAARGVTVLFGGSIDLGSVASGETWEWNGTVWTQRAVSGPSPRVEHAMAYDAARGVTVLFGGYGGSDGGSWRGDTWEWNGTAWTRRVVSGPSPRFGEPMAFDAARGATVLFGGDTQVSGTNGETWILGSACGSADFNHDGVSGSDADIEAFFGCIAGNCCATCGSADFNGDGDTATDADIEAFFRVLAGGSC